MLYMSRFFYAFTVCAPSCARKQANKEEKTVKLTKCLAVGGAACMLFAGVGCNPGGYNAAPDEVVIWSTTGQENAAWLQEIGKELQKNEGIRLKIVATHGDYNSILTSFARGNRPDVVYVDDEYFKRFADGGFIMPLDDLIEEYWADSDLIDVDAIWGPAISRYRFEVSNNTSNADDPLWCIPKDADPTVLYYNEEALEAVGVTVISVDVEDMEAWNKGEIADANGKKKSDYPALAGTTGNIPARGYWRSDNKNYTSGETWEMPGSGTLLVFNNRIPMSWDETEDLAMLCTKKHNVNSDTTYGYYTEWWFNYGWSVGGDCIGDTTGDGDYVFTLNDDAPNYKVLEEVTVNGTSYTPGTEDAPTFLSYQDKQYLKEHSSEAQQFTGGGKLEEYPSTLDAFTRFCALSRTQSNSDPKGLEISPMPSAVADTWQAASRFNSEGYLAMFVGYSSAVKTLSDDYDWNVAPLPVYKTYARQMTGEVDQLGARAGHSKSTGLAIAAKTEKVEMAMTVIEYLAGKTGQTALAEEHLNLPNTEEVAMESYIGDAQGKNYQQFAVETRYQKPGDWWYMLDREWIANWSEPLNQNVNSVRNGGTTLKDYFDDVVADTNADLKYYKEQLGG